MRRARRWTWLGVVTAVTLGVIAVPTPPASASTAGQDGRIVIDRCCTGDVPLLSMSPDGTDVRAVGWGRRPAWSPDGNRLAYDTWVNTGPPENPSATGGVTVVVANPDMSNETWLVDPDAYTAVSPAWSPDGTRLALWAAERPGGASGIFLVNTDRSGLTLVPGSSGWDEPKWSPSGDALLVTGTGPWSSDVVEVVTTAGQVLADLGSGRSGDWSPDGQRIAFTDGDPGATQGLWVADADGSNRTRLHDASAMGPAWSPDGTTILFAAPSAGGGCPCSLATISPDGTGYHELPVAADGISEVDWQPVTGATTAPPPAVTTAARPTTVTTSAFSGGTVVSWAPPMVNGGRPINAYSVFAVSEGRVAAWQNVRGDVRSTSLIGLTNVKSPDIYVAASTDQGFGAPAGPFPVGPPDDGPATPPAAPSAVKATVGAGFLGVTWSPPSSDGHRPITAYSAVAVDAATGTVSAWTNVAADVRGVSLAGLVDGRAYAVSVLAWNALGPSAPGGPTTSTPSLIAPAARGADAPAWSAAVAGRGQITISWLPPTFDGGSPVTAYSAVVSDPLTGTVLGWKNLAPSARQATLSGLASGKHYRIQVLAWNQRGPGTPTLPATVTPT